ncbi:MAG: DUF533 domain-containing protein [Gammaproteobacteria bacterium]
MNLVKTLAKVAMGVMVARGVGKMMGGKSQSGASGTGGGGLGGLGGLLGGGTQRPGSSDIGRGLGGSDGVGGLSSGNPSSKSGGSHSSGQNGGGLGGLLESLTKGGLGQQGGNQSAPSASGSSGGGLADILGSVLGGGASSGGLGGLLESLGGGGASQNNTSQASSNEQGSCGPQQPADSGSLGGLLNQAFGGQTAAPQPEQNAQAEIMLRGMLNAAKSDGKFDQAEQQKVMEHLGDISPDELEFVQTEMQKPLDVDAFVRSVPRGMEQQVYVMSLLGIELDSQAEAQYLDRLAKGLGISAAQANAIHDQVGVPKLYG